MYVFAMYKHVFFLLEYRLDLPIDMVELCFFVNTLLKTEAIELAFFMMHHNKPAIRKSKSRTLLNCCKFVVSHV